MGLLNRYWLHLLLLGLLTVFCVWLYNAGSESGANAVQKQWDKAKAEQQKAIDTEKEKIAKLEETHRTEVTRLTHDLAEAQKTHQVELATAAAEFRDRLRSSEERAAIYRRQAEGGSADRGSLASYASRLDVALEEGRALEREYRSTLGLRDEQIKALSRQIKADRSLLEEK